MTISKRVRSQFFTSSAALAATESTSSSKITTGTLAAALLDVDAEASTLIRLPLTRPIPGKRKRKSRVNKSLASQQRKALGWSDEEHDRFLHALELHPTGPWKNVAAFVGTRTTRQVMTHAQKYRQKIERRRRGLQIPVRKPHSTTGTSTSPSSTAATAEDTVNSDITATIARTMLPVSSPDYVINDLASNSSSAIELEHPIGDTSNTSTQLNSPCFPIAMAEDEFRLTVEELYTETEMLCRNQLECDQTTAVIHPNLDYFEDLLALMFQDPSSSSSFSWPQSAKSLFPMDVMYSVHALMEHVSVEIPYECHL